MANAFKEDYMLTTFDNPFNPFKDFDAWWKEDLRLSHDCCGLLANEANTSELFSDEINHKLEQEAIVRIVERFPMIYKKVLPKDFENVNV